MLSLGFSPCPNDTFIFYALAQGRLDRGGLDFGVTVADVETLNQRALRRDIDVSKVSCSAYYHLRDHYTFLSSGAALGRGCGPLVVARSADVLEGKTSGPLTIAVPGRYTTAFLLLRIYLSTRELRQAPSFLFMPFHTILSAVEKTEADAGLIIHESRFIYPLHGLVEAVDLGAWWETVTGLPIPLGGIVARKSLGDDVVRHVEALIRSSVEYSVSNRDEAMPYIRAYAQELSDTVIRQHIALYVNEYSLDIGSLGQAALEELLARADTIERSL